MRRILIASVMAAALTLPAHAAAVSDLVSPPQVVRSGDRLVTLTIPRGALTKAVPIRIKTLKRSALEGKLRAAAAPGPVYELLPSGLRFAKPITITRRVRGFAPSEGIPVLVPAVRDARGKWSLLGRPSIRREGATVVVSGTTRHFSTAAAFDEGGRVSLEPATVRASVGESFRATARFVRDRDLSFARGWIGQGEDGGVVQFLSDERIDKRTDVADYLCASPGTGIFGVKVGIRNDGALGFFLESFVGVVQRTEYVKVAGTAVCEAETPLNFSLTWGHPAGASSSYVCADITAASGALLQLEATGPGGYSVNGKLQLKKKKTPTAHGTFSFGIFQVGTYTVDITSTAGDKSVTKEKSIEVTGAPGSPNCGP